MCEDQPPHLHTLLSLTSPASPSLPPVIYIYIELDAAVEAAETDYNGRLWSDCTAIMLYNYKERESEWERRMGPLDAQMSGSISFRE